MMDNVKKAKFEQRVILILLAVFVACFVHMLRKLGFIGGKPQPAAPTAVGAPAVAPVPAVAQAVERYRERMAEVQTSGVGTVIRPPDEPGVALSEQEPLPRDPLMSLLPGDLPPPVAVRQKGKGAVAGAADMAGGGMSPPQGQPPPLTVQGVIVGGPRPQALIDEGVYGVGDVVKGARIVAIGREGVLVITPGGLYHLTPDAGAKLVTQVPDWSKESVERFRAARPSSAP